MEYEAKREVLKQLGICKLDNLLQLQTALWIYLTQDWLRLAVPSESDTNQTRWPTHPLWDQIIHVFDQGGEQPKLQRFTPARLPADERLFVHGMGGQRRSWRHAVLWIWVKALASIFIRRQNFTIRDPA